MLETLIYMGVGLLTVSIPLYYFNREKRKSAKAAMMLDKSIISGLDEPVSLHPYIDPDICIGTAACVSACPEKDVLGLVDRAGKLVKPSVCIGHGLCQASCPVDAITLVFGSQKRGVDIPYLKGNFESNVSGIYIAGELGGMGLIRNAVTQGKQAAENIAKAVKNGSRNAAYDLVIVGAGPAGISASLQAEKEGLKFITIDQDDLGGTILTYPRQKLVMTQPMELPLFGMVKAREIQKEELLVIFNQVFSKTGLSVNSEEKVLGIKSEKNLHSVKTDKGEYLAHNVLLAIGRRGSPRKLGVPGEKSAKVAYRLLDPEKYSNKNIIVVGGGDSAVEAAVSLSEQPGNQVHLSYRKEALFRLKEGNRDRFNAAVADKKINPLFSSNIIEIRDQDIRLSFNGKEHQISNDNLFIFAGGVMPAQFLKDAGVKFERKFGEA